jgi:hypothetical protein
MQSFSPQVNQNFSIFLSPLELRFEPIPHPQASNMVHSMRAGKATVYRLRDMDAPGEYALKVMKARFRDPGLEAKCEQLDSLKRLTGLEVCDRRCLSSTLAPETIKIFPRLEYSILMPWIQGPSWWDVHISEALGEKLTKSQCFRLASNFAAILARIESTGFAHCDLSPANVMVDLNTESPRVELIDVEEFFGPGFATPQPRPIGTTGYQHKASRASGWNAESDRFSGALLIAEMLAWHATIVRQYSYGESYFAPGELQGSPPCQRYQSLSEAVRDQSAQLEDLLRRAWVSNEIAECPPLREWSKTFQQVQAASPDVIWVPTDYRQPRRKPARRCWNRQAPEAFWKV